MTEDCLHKWEPYGEIDEHAVICVYCSKVESEPLK